MNGMIEDLKLAYEALQNLKIQPTRSNMRILCYAEDVIQRTYMELTENAESEKESGGDGKNGTD